MKKYLIAIAALTAFTSAHAATTETTAPATTTATETTKTTTTAEAKKGEGCKSLKEACSAAGYTTKKDGTDTAGKGLYANCIDPYLAGSTVEGLDITKIKTDKTEACKAHRLEVKAAHKDAAKTAKAEHKAAKTAAKTAAPATTDTAAPAAPTTTTP